MGGPQSRFREWESGLSARIKNVGVFLKGIITRVEEKAMGCMTLPDSYWNDSDTYTQLERTGKKTGGLSLHCNSSSPRGDKKVDKMLGGKKKKGIKRYSERGEKKTPNPQTPKNECHFMEEIF